MALDPNVVQNRTKYASSTKKIKYFVQGAREKQVECQNNQCTEEAAGKIFLKELKGFLKMLWRNRDDIQ